MFLDPKQIKKFCNFKTKLKLNYFNIIFLFYKVLNLMYLTLKINKSHNICYDYQNLYIKILIF